MVDNNYMNSRKRYARPQAMLFSDNAGTFISNAYVPTGIEWQDFIITSDHNRSDISMNKERIEDRRRMINGTMRSYWTADKITISTSWDMLPSRSYSAPVDFDYDGEGGQPGIPFDESGNPVVHFSGMSGTLSTTTTEYTTDGGAGGVELLRWYEDHPGPFWVYLAYDKYDIDGTKNYNKLGIYNQILHMYISSFDYSIRKRGATNHDLWNVNISLEEV